MGDEFLQTEKLRYRAFYWLMNASFIMITFGLVSEVLEAFTGIYAFGMPDVLVTVTVPIGMLLATVVPVLLLSIPAWRDEYADLLWKKAVSVLVISFAVGPLLLFVFFMIAYQIIGGEEPPEWLGLFFDPQRPVDVLLRSWWVFNAAFVFIFQIVRWSDSR